MQNISGIQKSILFNVYIYVSGKLLKKENSSGKYGKMLDDAVKMKSIMS